MGLDLYGWDGSLSSGNSDSAFPPSGPKQESQQQSTGQAIPDPWEYYFLDWRPVSASPVDEVGPPRLKEISLADIQPYLGAQFLVVPNVEAFLGATIMARTDGFFVVQIRLDPTSGFNIVHLEELALVVCMAAKQKLGHHHDVHSPRPHRRSSSKEAADILVTYPVEIVPADWKQNFAKQTFTDADVTTCDCVPPLSVAPDEVPRKALVCLRRSYLKVFENVQALVNFDRGEQIRWQRSWRFRRTLIAYSLIAIAALFVTIVDTPRSLEDGFYSLLSREFISSTVILMPLLWVFFSYLLQMLEWDRPRIRLLRSTETFYAYANPINRVISRLVHTKSLDAVDDFGDLISVVQSKTAGEIHRMTLHQLWLSLSLATFAIYFSALAIRADTEEPLTDASVISGQADISSADCGSGERWSVGPFVLGSADSLDLAARTPASIAAAVKEATGSRNLVSIMVLGSTDAAEFLQTSELQSNDELAIRRARWAAETLLAALDTVDLDVVHLNESLRISRIATGANEIASEREVIVCARWASEDQGSSPT